MYPDDDQMYVKGRDHETVGRRMKTCGQQALSWYSNNCLLANPDKFQSLNINPWKLEKDKRQISTLLSILKNYVRGQARKLEYSLVFEA